MTGKKTQHVVWLNEQDRNRAELIGAVYGFPVTVVMRAGLRMLFAQTGLPIADAESAESAGRGGTSSPMI